MAGDLDQLRDDVEEYFRNSNRPLIYTNWVSASICPQLMWFEDDTLGVDVEVISTYDNFKDLEQGDDILNAPGELGDVGQTFVDAIEANTGADVSLRLSYSGPSSKGVPTKLYRSNIQVR